MLTKRQEEILEALANTYDSYTSSFSRYPTDWAKHRSELDGGLGGQLIDRCYNNSQMMGSIMKNITDGLVTRGVEEKEDPVAYKNAVKACQMVEKLYRDDPSITKSLNEAWSNDQTAIKQLSTGGLKEVLITKRIFEEETKLDVSKDDSPQPRH